MAYECDICLKHRGRGRLSGELIGRGDGFWVYHAMPDAEGKARLGWLFIESDRHVPYMADLDAHEAASLGELRTSLANALRQEVDAQLVLTFVIGMGIAHFHEHLVPRAATTPQDVAWYDTAESLPKADQQQVANLASRLRARLGLAPS
jgi:ATP adenylyltransferase